MDFFRKIGGGIKEGVEDTKFKADQFMRIQQVEGEIRSITKDSERTKEELAIETYTRFKQREISNEPLVAICKRLDSLLEQISIKQKKIEAIKAEPLPSSLHIPVLNNICPACGAFINPGAVFCTNCGYKINLPPDSLSLEEPTKE